MAEGMKLTVSRDGGNAGRGSSPNSRSPPWRRHPLCATSKNPRAETEARRPGRSLGRGCRDHPGHEDHRRAAGNTRRWSPSPRAIPWRRRRGQPSRTAPSPAVNRARGRVGFEYNSIRQAGGGKLLAAWACVPDGYDQDRRQLLESQRLLARPHRTRGAAHAQTQTITDLINRTYHLTLSYANPQSRWSAGFGRLYLPWANSLDTMDGGYIASRIGRSFTAGVFAGSTPDPTSWNYNPEPPTRRLLREPQPGQFRIRSLHQHGGRGRKPCRLEAGASVRFLRERVVLPAILSIYHNLAGRSDQRTAVREQRHPREPQFPDGAAAARAFPVAGLQPQLLSKRCPPSIPG